MSIIDRRGVSVDATDTAIAGDPNPGLAIKAPVRVATTAAITLSGLQTIDGIALADGDRVLVKDQADQRTNGLYNAATGLWQRTIDATSNDQWTSGTQVIVTSGTVNIGGLFRLTTADPITIGTSNLTFTDSISAALLPTPTATTLGGVKSLAAVTHQFLTSIGTDGAPTQAQPAFSDLSGSIAASQLIAPTASTLGGVKSLAAVTHNFLTSIGTDGSPTQAQPAQADISGLTTADSPTFAGLVAASVIGGRLAASSLILQSTSNAAPNGDSILLKVGGNTRAALVSAPSTPTTPGAWFNNAGNGYALHVRDRLFVDDGCLNDGSQNLTVGPLANSGAGTAINNAGWAWLGNSASLQVINSHTSIAVVGMGVSSGGSTQLANPTTGGGTVSGGAFLGLNDYTTHPYGTWGVYVEAARIGAAGDTAGMELDIGNTGTMNVFPLYAAAAGALTTGIGVAAGGSLDLGTHTYTNVSAALNFASNGAKFDKGIVFATSSLVDHGSGVGYAINFPDSYEMVWWKNNAGADAIQATIKSVAGVLTFADATSYKFSSLGAGIMTTSGSGDVSVTTTTGSGAVVKATGPTITALNITGQLGQTLSSLVSNVWSITDTAAGGHNWLVGPASGTGNVDLFGIYSAGSRFTVNGVTGEVNVPGGGLTIGAPTGGAKGSGTINSQASHYINGTQVLGARVTGYTAMTGSPDKATPYATSSVTLAQLAGRVAQIQADLTTHGLIGP